MPPETAIMTLEMIFVLLLVGAAVALFATERLPIDLTALVILGVMLLSGLIDSQDALAGFSNPATITVGAMFVLSAGLFKTGAVNLISRILTRLARISYWLVLVVMMLLVGGLSAFINNTAAVAVFIPVAIAVAREAKVGPGRLLMPLSFASMFGGVCTLIGTSTNILVSSIAQRHGLPPIGMFEMSQLGLIFFGTGFVFMVGAVLLIPDRTGEDRQARWYAGGEYQIELVLDEDSRSVGKTLAKSPLLRDIDIKAVEVFRDGALVPAPADVLVLQAGDHLKVRCGLEEFRKLRGRRGVTLRHEHGAPRGEETELVEAVVAPESSLDGGSLRQAHFRTLYGQQALAIKHRQRIMRQNLEDTRLRAGDVLLFEVERAQVRQLKEDPNFVLVSRTELPMFRTRKMLTATAIVAGVVAGAATGYVPIVAGAILGCILMVLTGCLDLEEAYAAINWKVIFLLAGVLTLGAAMEKTGAAALLGGELVEFLGGLGPVALLSGLYLVTSLLTELMSNNAAAALLAPIAIGAAESMGINARPFLMAIAFAASASFMTPVGYQTNTMIYGPGQFRYADFLRVGTPLNLIFWVLATLMIPRFWPF